MLKLVWKGGGGMGSVWRGVFNMEKKYEMQGMEREWREERA